MNARAMNTKTLIAAAAAALLLLLGAGVAYATGQGGDTSGGATGSNLDKAKSVALRQVEGRVTGSEVGDEEGAYQIEVTKDDGTQVDVNLDKNFDVINAEADRGGPEDQDGPDGQDAADEEGG